jgi:hypothetical protein
MIRRPDLGRTLSGILGAVISATGPTPDNNSGTPFGSKWPDAHNDWTYPR